MPPKKKDKGKGILKDPVSQTPPKAPQPTSPKEKLLSSAMPIKSWIDAIEEDEAKVKALASQNQVNEWISSITKSPELMLAIQSFSQSQISSKDSPKEIPKVHLSEIPLPILSKSSSKEIVSSGSTSSQVVVSQSKLSQKSDWFHKPHSQNVLTMEDGFYNADPFQAISKFFPKGWFFKPWDLTKPQSYYQSILEASGSVKFKHFFLSEAHSEPAYSTATILKVHSPNQWGHPLHKQIAFPANFLFSIPHCSSYSYWDYQQAWFNTFFLQNPKKSHSWLFFFNSKITVQSLPNWFQQWWTFFGPSPDILTPNATHCFDIFKAHYLPSESEKRFSPFLCFCTNFFLPWVWMWNFQYHKQETQLILQRHFKIKWWSKFDEKSKLTEFIIETWLKQQGHLKPSIQDVKAQSSFLAQRSKAQALLASAKTEDEYFKVMEQLLTTRSEPSVAESSDHDSEDEAEEPFISLGDENEDDCFGIFPPIKHCK